MDQKNYCSTWPLEKNMKIKPNDTELVMFIMVVYSLTIAASSVGQAQIL